MNGVRYFRNIVFALAAFLWLPVSVHCQLETVPGLEFLRCATEGQNSEGNCNDSGCCAVEKSQYKSEQSRPTVISADVLPMPSARILDTANSLPAEVSIGILTAAPPELVQTRHFLSRTALPARAPSIAS